MRYRTPAPALSGNEARTDRRIQRTRALLHEALGSLMQEKTYDRITVADVLDRAKVSRSTFYMHFRDKDDLLRSSMRALLLGVLSREATVAPDTAEQMAAFSLPLLTHIHQHHRAAKARLGERGQAILHAQLRYVLADWIAQTTGAESRRRRAKRMAVDPELLAQHVASTFVLTLHWWFDHASAAAPAEIDKLFRALVMPVLRTAPAT